MKIQDYYTISVSKTIPSFFIFGMWSYDGEQDCEAISPLTAAV